jgi:hypothetical protein
MSLSTPIAIRTLQRKLYRKAKAEPAFRLFNPSADDFPHGGVKKSLYGVEGFDCAVLIAAPVRHLHVILFDKRHVRLPSAKFGPSIPLR